MAEEKSKADGNICKELIIKLDTESELGVEDSEHMTWTVDWERSIKSHGVKDSLERGAG